MRQIIKYLSLMSLLACMFSCGLLDGDNKTNAESPETIAQLSDSVKSLKTTQDSINRALLEKVDTLTKELNKANTDIMTLKSNLLQQSKPGSLWNSVSIVSFIVSLIAIVISLFRDNNARNKQALKDLDSKSQGFDNQFAKIQCAIQKLLDMHHTSTQCLPSLQSGVNHLRQRVDRIEQEVKKPIVAQTTDNNKKKDGINAPTTYTEYSKAISSKFFTELLSSQQEGCIYRITYTNETDGRFEIVSLSKMKQSNGWEEVVETTGKCPISDANHHKVVEPGKCRKREELWEVTDKLKIEISK